MLKREEQGENNWTPVMLEIMTTLKLLDCVFSLDLGGRSQSDEDITGKISEIVKMKEELSERFTGYESGVLVSWVEYVMSIALDDSTRRDIIADLQKGEVGTMTYVL